ncbi:MAG: FAD-dependent oxidoreductase, partial [Comamonadaceae bacterium]
MLPVPCPYCGTFRSIAGHAPQLATQNGLAATGDDVKLRDGYDVVVVGGGTAGAIAGIAAARTGARTLLVEQYGTLGGVLGLGMSLKGVHDGDGHLALGGYGGELLERARAAGAATTVVSAHPRHGSIMGQDPEALKLALIEMVRDSGLQLLLHAFLVDVLRDGDRVQAVRVATKAG